LLVNRFASHPKRKEEQPKERKKEKKAKRREATHRPPFFSTDQPDPNPRRGALRTHGVARGNKCFSFRLQMGSLRVTTKSQSYVPSRILQRVYHYGMSPVLLFGRSRARPSRAELPRGNVCNLVSIMRAEGHNVQSSSSPCQRPIDLVQRLGGRS
jgi:hypothetical protein